MKENNWNFTFSESFLKTMKELNKVQLPASAIAMSQAWRTAVPKYELNGAYTALNEIVASHKAWSEAVFPAHSFSAMVAAMSPTVKVDVSSIAQSVMGQMNTSALIALRESASRAVLAADWSWLSEVHCQEAEDEAETVSEDMITPEIRSEIAEDITQILSDPEHMETVSQSKYLQWKERNPGLAAFFLDILYPFLLMLIPLLVSIWTARPIKDSKVYEKPTSTSNVVCNLTIENNVTVVGDMPYYYEIEFAHPETGEMVTGYIYKGNVAAEESEETEAQVEETTAVEESEPIPDVTAAQTELTE